MNILAIDTSLSDISVGCSTSAGMTATRSFKHERDALRRLAGLMKDTMDEVGISPSDIDVVACAQGPGSFTGLRVGIAAAKAFADAVGAVMTGVSTLMLLAMAADIDEGQVVMPLIEACVGELYYGLYAPVSDGGVTALVDDSIMAVQDIPEWLSGLHLEKNGLDREAIQAQHRHSTPIVMGPAVEKYMEYLSGAIIKPDPNSIRISDLLSIAKAFASAGRTMPAEQFLPDYLRASQAEIRAQMLENQQ